MDGSFKKKWLSDVCLLEEPSRGKKNKTKLLFESVKSKFVFVNKLL